jgi:hypothetical protein
MNVPGNIKKIGNYRYRPNESTSLYKNIPNTVDQEDNGNYYNERMRVESDKRRNFCDSRRDNIKNRYNSTHVDTSVEHMKLHTKLRMGNGNDNENRIEIKDEIKDAFDGYCQSRKRKPTARAKRMVLKQLNEWYPDDYERQKQCLDQSTMNGWQGIFKIKDEINKSKGVQSGFGFQKAAASKYDDL